MKKVLITGASGFVGGYLAEHLLSLGNYEIYGTYHSEKNKEASPVKDAIHFFQVDLQNKETTESLVKEVNPELIFHLAAQANVPESFKDPVGTFHANVDSQLNLFEALRVNQLTNTRVLIVASSEVYGYVKEEDLPVDEETPLRPANPYSVSKIAQDYLGFQYHLSYQMPIIRVRAFNHVGPRQEARYVVSDFAKQVASIEKGIQEPIMKLGNLEARRDITDVRDMVRAYHLLIEKGESGEVYNIGSGQSHAIQEVLDILLSYIAVPVTVEKDPEKFRPSDIPDIVADTTKIKNLTGWQPEISLKHTLKDTLDYWRKMV